MDKKKSVNIGYKYNENCMPFEKLSFKPKNLYSMKEIHQIVSIDLLGIEYDVFYGTLRTAKGTKKGDIKEYWRFDASDILKYLEDRYKKTEQKDLLLKKGIDRFIKFNSKILGIEPKKPVSP